MHTSIYSSFYRYINLERISLLQKIHINNYTYKNKLFITYNYADQQTQDSKNKNNLSKLQIYIQIKKSKILLYTHTITN